MMNKTLVTTLLTITLAACSPEPTLDMTTKETQAETLPAVLASNKLTDKQKTDLKASVELIRWAFETAKGTEREDAVVKLIDEVYQGRTGLEILDLASKAK